MDIENIDNQYIKQKMNEHSISTVRALAEIMQVPENVLSTMVTGAKGLTKWHKSLIYKTFHCLELEKELKELQLKTNSSEEKKESKLLTNLIERIDQVEKDLQAHIKEGHIIQSLHKYGTIQKDDDTSAV